MNWSAWLKDRRLGQNIFISCPLNCWLLESFRIWNLSFTSEEEELNENWIHALYVSRPQTPDKDPNKHYRKMRKKSKHETSKQTLLSLLLVTSLCTRKPCSFFVFFFLFRFFIYFIFGCVGSLLLHAGFPLAAASGGYSSLRCVDFSCGGFSCCGVWALGARASVVVAHGRSSCGSWALERRLSSCGARASLLRGMWDLPWPGLEPMSPALAGGFLTTVPPGKLHAAS